MTVKRLQADPGRRRLCIHKHNLMLTHYTSPGERSRTWQTHSVASHSLRIALQALASCSGCSALQLPMLVRDPN